MILRRIVTISSRPNRARSIVFVSMLSTCRSRFVRDIRRHVYDIDEDRHYSMHTVSTPRETNRDEIITRTQCEFIHRQVRFT
jgi:hypothetical protein